MGATSERPLQGLRIIEVRAGVSQVGTGIAAGLPGLILSDLGAEVRSVQWGEMSLDSGVRMTDAWDSGKEVLRVRAADGPRVALAESEDADLVFVAGSEEEIEGQGLGSNELLVRSPQLVHVRLRPSRGPGGASADYELLVQARTGFLSQVRGHRPGPLYCDLMASNVGAALVATVGGLARLYERESTGRGGSVQTSLYDGLLAIFPLLIGRAARPTPSTASLWESLGPEIGLAFRCADNKYVQLWLGVKGAYEALLEYMGDPPSDGGYAADTLSGAIKERSRRWAEKFASHDREWWMDHLAGRNDFRCEAVLRPGEILLDPHVESVGLSSRRSDPVGGTIMRMGPFCTVRPAPGPMPSSAEGVERGVTDACRLLESVRVLDLSTFGAGPMATRILAGLGADVAKIEPPSGDAHRGMEPMFASVQQGKRSIVLDLKDPASSGFLQRLFQWSDVVHHSSRVGLAQKLGYDEATVRLANPAVVYSHATGFGSHGPRSGMAANDYLIQALSGIEAAAGGAGQPPLLIGGAPVDITNGWLTASAIIAGLLARRRTGVGQSVTTSLLGAGMILKSGALFADGTVVEGPQLDHAQTGYGAAYRIYRGRNGTWFALAVPDKTIWQRLRTATGSELLPPDPPPLRTNPDDREATETLLEEIFATKDAAAWVRVLGSMGVPVELVVELDRPGFVARILDDPVNQELGRLLRFDWGPLGQVEQVGLPLSFDPPGPPTVTHGIAALGEHTDQFRAALFDSPAPTHGRGEDGGANTP